MAILTQLKPIQFPPVPEPLTERDPKPRIMKLGKLWLYGNVILLDSNRSCSEVAFATNGANQKLLESAERESEEIVLSGKTLVCGIHSDLHQRASIVPLRWGAPRIVVVGSGFYNHLGPNLDEELFKAARLWRYEFDPLTDLVISKYEPMDTGLSGKRSGGSDKLIRRIASASVGEILRGTFEYY